MNRRILVLFMLVASNAIATPSIPSDSEITTAAAMGYCLAKHPYRTIHTGTFTPDGYEIVSSPGIVGAVRRNFIYDRTSIINDEGTNNNCTKACSQFGKFYGPNFKGVPLKQQLGNGTGTITINSGIGDMATLAIPDRDFILNQNVIGGIFSRGNSFQESDVAQADFCCCQAK